MRLPVRPDSPVYGPCPGFDHQHRRNKHSFHYAADCKPRPSYQRPRNQYNSISHTPRRVDYDVSFNSKQFINSFHAHTLLMEIANTRRAQGVTSVSDFRAYLSEFVDTFAPMQEEGSITDFKAWNIFLSALPLYVSNPLGRDQSKFSRITPTFLDSVELFASHLYENEAYRIVRGMKAVPRQEIISTHRWDSHAGQERVEISSGGLKLQRGRLAHESGLNITPISTNPDVTFIPAVTSPSALPTSFVTKQDRREKKREKKKRRAERRRETERDQIEVEEELPNPVVSVPSAASLPTGTVPSLVSIDSDDVRRVRFEALRDLGIPIPPSMLPSTSNLKPFNPEGFERIVLNLSEKDISHKFIYIRLPINTPFERISQDTIPLSSPPVSKKISSRDTGEHSNFLGIDTRPTPSSIPVPGHLATGTVAF